MRYQGMKHSARSAFFAKTWLHMAGAAVPTAADAAGAAGLLALPMTEHGAYAGVLEARALPCPEPGWSPDTASGVTDDIGDAQGAYTLWLN